MSETYVRQKIARRRVQEFVRKFGRDNLHLAYHAALPVVLNAELLHLLRINFFLDSPEPLPYTAETDLLLSPLCQEIGDGLYEIESAIRDVLLRGLLTEYGHERIRQVAALLWQYIERGTPWRDQVRLDRAQQLTALNFLDPQKAKQWLEEAEAYSGQSVAGEREWFVAMHREVGSSQVSEAKLSMKPMVLLADDDVNWLRICLTRLPQTYYTLKTSDSIESALRLLSAETFAVVIADIGIPGTSGGLGGFELLDRIKDLSPDTRVVTITAYGGGLRDIAQEALRRGAHNFVQKPIDFQELDACIVNAIDYWKQMREFRELIERESVTPQIFLSYAREDEEKVESLYQKLSNAGFKPWMDKKDILPGEEWESGIQRAIQRSDFFLACLSTDSVTRRGFIHKEIRYALDILQEILDRDIYLIPVRLEDCEIPESLRDFQWVNLFEEDGWTQLAKAIQVEMEHRAEGPETGTFSSERPKLIEFIFTPPEPTDYRNWFSALRRITEEGRANGGWTDNHGAKNGFKHLEHFVEPFCKGQVYDASFALYSKDPDGNFYEHVEVIVKPKRELSFEVTDRTQAQRREELANRILQGIGNLEGVRLISIEADLKRLDVYPAIRQLANLIRARREAGDRPYILLLGSSLSLTPDVRQAVCGDDDWEAFWTAIQGLSASERRALLAGPLEDLKLTAGYDCLAQLVQAGYFDLVLILNVDDGLDESLRILPAREYQILTHGQVPGTEIAAALGRTHPRVKAVKLRGDINAYKLPLTPEGQFEFPEALEEVVERLLSQDTILVGDIPHDTDIQRCIRQGEGALWVVVPEGPRPGGFLYNAKRARPKGEVISGPEAEFVSFFSALARDLEG